MSWSDDADALPLVEARHRMANVFQLLATLGRLRAQRGQDPEARRQVGWMLDAIAALGVLQQRQLSPGGEDFAEFLKAMGPIWRRRIADRPVAIELAAEPLAVSEAAASALAMIVQELVANALAHAFPDGREGLVRIGLQRLEAGRAALTVADDGVGYLAEAADAHRLGLWLIEGLAGQIGGELTIVSDGGVTARLEFPAV